MRSLRIFALAAITLAAVGPTASADPADPAERMIEKINDVRAKHGLRALREAPKLAKTSRDFARHLIRTDSFGHGTSYREAGFRHAGEIIALSRGWSRRPRPTLRMWLSSPGHAELILEPGFRYVGASPARGRFGDAPTTIWVAQFGAH